MNCLHTIFKREKKGIYYCLYCNMHIPTGNYYKLDTPFIIFNRKKDLLKNKLE